MIFRIGVGRTRRFAALAVGVAAVALPALAGPPASPANPYQSSPGVSPLGSNDFSCRPTATHPEPVVLVHGTEFDMEKSWNVLSPALKGLGYCVFALDYGHQGTDPVERSAGELSAFVDRVLTATGAARVSIVGHSQGGMMPRYYVRFLGGGSKVDRLVGLAPSNHGTTTPLAPLVGTYGMCEACTEQVAGSDFLNTLNAGDQAPAPVNYSNIETTHDEIVTPYQSAFLPPAANVSNVTLQDDCPADVTEHIGIIYDPVALQWAIEALRDSGPVDTSFVPDCTGTHARLIPAH